LAITGHPVIEQSLFTDAWKPPERGTPQYDFLHCFRPEVSLIGGRGTHKTGMLVASEALAANVHHAHISESIGYITEQTNKLLKDTLMPMIKKFINPDLYFIKGGDGERDIHWVNTGGITRLRSRQAKNPNDPPPFRGPSCERVGHDEIAIDKNPPDEDKDPILISMAMLRGENAVRSLRNCTTPQRNWFYTFMKSRGIAANGLRTQTSPDGNSRAFYSNTIDVDPHLHSILARSYSKEFIKQELEAYWADGKGKIWDTFDFSGDDAPGLLWPKSNIHKHSGFDPRYPWVLGADLGAVASAFIVLQSLPTGTAQKRVLVAVAEWTPGTVKLPRILNEIQQYTNGVKPHAVWVGHDINTPGGHDGTTPYLAFSQVGWGDVVRTHVGQPTFQKSAQHMAMSGAICNGAGERRFAISKNLESFHECGRGIREVLEMDTFPEKGNDYFRKNKTEGTLNLEDSRDAMLYPVAGIFPPRDHKYAADKLARY